MSSNYDWWIHQQLEPTDILTHSGRPTKSNKTLFAKWELEDAERERLGDEEYMRRELEWQEWENNQKENND